MNSRRLMHFLFKPKGRPYHIANDVRFGLLADMCSALGDVRFVPIADIAIEAHPPR
jgi:hypothetical protein